MSKMGKYCKAYPISSLRQFIGWKGNVENARKEKIQLDGKEVEVTRQLTDGDFLYLQEDFTVTDGVFIDEHVIFDHPTPEWVSFCKNELKFDGTFQ